MPRVANTLTDLEVKALTNPGHHPVGGVPGLLLQIRPSGSRYWVYRTHIAGKRCNIGIGSTGEYTLAGAREEARELRPQVVSSFFPCLLLLRKVGLFLLLGSHTKTPPWYCPNSV